MKTSNGIERHVLSQLIQRLKEVEVFSNLQEDIHREIAHHIQTFELAPNEVLVRQGDDAKNLYFLLSGRLSVILKDQSGSEQVVADLPAGSIIGEIAIVVGGKRSATVVGAEASTLGVLSAAALTRLMNRHPEVMSNVVSMASRRLREGQLALHLVRLYEGFDAASIREFQNVVEWISLSAGEILFRRGEPADAAYLVVSGRLRVMVEDGFESSPFYQDVAPGEIVGDLPMVLEENHSTTMAAVRETEIARIPRSVYDGWIERRPRMMYKLIQTAFRRVRRSGAPSDNSLQLRRSVAIVSLDAQLDLAPLVASLKRMLAYHGSTIVLPSVKVDALLHVPGISQSAAGSPANTRLLQWLDEVEKSHCYVVYLADCSRCEWGHRVIRQADHVVFVAQASGDSGLREIELNHRYLFDKDPLRSSLLLIHDPDTTRPVNTFHWLKNRSADAVYHLRGGNDKDLVRLVRILAGRAVSLVLGGGGARGFAHLGVLRALEELSIPVDMIGGTSVGAPIALAPAQGMDAAQTQACAAQAFDSLMDYTLPVVSLLAGRRITRNIESYAKPWNIEDLWLPYFCVSTNITKARSVVHRRGDLARAVRASVSIPGVLPPVSFNGDLHVDGGILNNLPIDVMRKLNPTGTIIAVDVLPPMGPRAKSEYPLGLSGLKVMGSRLLPWFKAIRVPTLGSTILASMTIGSASSLRSMLDDQLADIYLSINVRGVSMLKFKNLERIADIGYRQSIKPLRKWKETDLLIQNKGIFS
jgi:predicted acylesterase/phospholipase RssA/CRP-like cAMP-binding protein